MDVVFWNPAGGLIARQPAGLRAGFIPVPDGAARVTVDVGGDHPHVWMLSMDGRREECAWDSGDWPTCTAPVRVVAVAEYSDGRILTRTFCPDHGQQWAEGLTLHPTVHDLRSVVDVPPVPAREGARPIAPGALGPDQIVLHQGVPYRVVKATHRTDGTIRMKGCEQFSTGGEGEPEWLELGKPNRLFILNR